MNVLSTLTLMRAPPWPSDKIGPRHFPLPPAPLPVAPGRRPPLPPLCHAWGVGGDIHGVVQRDKDGVCASFVVNHLNGDRETFDIERMSPNATRELAVRLTQQADAWDREFGQGDAA